MSRPVQPWHLQQMAVRVSDAARDRAYAVMEDTSAGLDGAAYLLAAARHERRMKALSRLTEALERRLDVLVAARVGEPR